MHFADFFYFFFILIVSKRISRLEKSGCNEFHLLLRPIAFFHFHSVPRQQLYSNKPWYINICTIPSLMEPQRLMSLMIHPLLFIPVEWRAEPRASQTVFLFPFIFTACKPGWSKGGGSHSRHSLEVGLQCSKAVKSAGKKQSSVWERWRRRATH